MSDLALRLNAKLPKGYAFELDTELTRISAEYRRVMSDMIAARLATQERTIVRAIERGVRYVRFPLPNGCQVVFDTHELDADATGVPE